MQETHSLTPHDQRTEDSPLSPPSEAPISRAFRQLALQGAAAIFILSLAWPYYGLRGEALPWPATALAIGAAAFAMAVLTRQARWWQLIHAGFAPLLWGAMQFDISPNWFLAAFIVSLLFFRGAVSGQIPLYLTNATTLQALANLLASSSCKRFADIGAGVGSTVKRLGKALPATQFNAIENAPASWAIGRLRTFGLTNVTWHLEDFWRVPLADYDVVYAFLSPTPMPALWRKARQEMTPGSWLISNTFAIPDVEPEHEIEVADSRGTRLYWYRIPSPPPIAVKDECPDD